MKILITGGNGFIGSHLADSLSSHGHELVLFDKEFSWHTQDVDAQKLIGDVTDSAQVFDAARGVDLIVHLAAVSRVEDAQLDAPKCLRTNVDGTLYVAEAALKNGAGLLFGSSREVFGSSRYVVDEDSPKHPLSIYGASKLAAENAIINSHRTNDLKYVIARLSNVYGSSRDRSERVIPRFVNQAIHEYPLTIYGGDQALDFIFIDDVVENLSRIVEKFDDGNGNDYNLVSGDSKTISELAALICRLTSSSSAITILPSRAYDVERFIAKPKKILLLLGESFHARTLPEGLALYIKRIQEGSS